jgi:hypothetical protein
VGLPEGAIDCSNLTTLALELGTKLGIFELPREPTIMEAGAARGRLVEKYRCLISRPHDRAGHHAARRRPLNAARVV